MKYRWAILLDDFDAKSKKSFLANGDNGAADLHEESGKHYNAA